MERLVHPIKAVCASLLAGSGLLRLVHRLRRPHLLVLAYHRVTPDAEIDRCAYPAMHVTVSTFQAQLQALKRLYRIVSVAEAERILSGEMPLREPTAVVTFDDGYQDNFRNALPVLAAAGVPAMFFLSVGFVDRGEPFWFDEVAAAARAWEHAPAGAVRIAKLPLPLVDVLSAPGSVVERARAAAAYLKTLPDAERMRAVANLRPLARDGSSDQPMNWTEVKGLLAAGMDLGAHGVRHGVLTRMPAAEAATEIGDSVAVIQARTGAAVQSFAYPNGDVNREVAETARQAGVRLGFTMDGYNVKPGQDLLRVARRNVCEDTSRGLDGKFSRGYFWCEMTGVFDVLTGRSWRSKRTDA